MKQHPNITPTRGVSRRSILAATTLSALSRARGANDRIAVGLIGVGGRGTYNLQEIKKCTSNVAVTAICDVYRQNRERAAALASEAWGGTPRLTADYRELLSWKDVDAVVISTPDFGHSRILQHAVEAGKDVYCEKPMGIDFEEAKSAYLSVKRSGCIVQVGTQWRSDGYNMAAAKLVQSGVLGTITRIDLAVNFQEPRWRRDYSKVKPEDVDWKRFLMHRRDRPFDARQFMEWQLFRDYTNGIAGLWMCHYINLVHWMMQDPYPASAVASGGVYLWKDGRQTSDVFQALFSYPKGFHVSFEMSLTNESADRNLWFGTRGVLDLDAKIISGMGSKRPDKLAGQTRIEAELTTSHMQDFLDCIRTRRAPRSDVQAGFSHAVAGCMATAAMETGRTVRFDPQKLAIL